MTDTEWVTLPKHATIEMEQHAAARLRGYHDIEQDDWRGCVPKDFFRLAWSFMQEVAPPPATPTPVSHVVGPIAWTTQAALEDLKSNPHRMAVMSGHPLEYADSAPVALYDHRPQTVSEGETVTRFRIEWVAGARPPVHPTPMTGKAWAATFEDAIAHMRAQASDAQFVSLSEVVTTTIKSDRSDDLRAALATTEGRE